MKKLLILLSPGQVSHQQKRITNHSDTLCSYPPHLYHPVNQRSSHLVFEELLNRILDLLISLLPINLFPVARKKHRLPAFHQRKRLPTGDFSYRIILSVMEDI